MSRHPYDILIRPLLTERSGDGSALPKPKYTFVVHIDSNKVQIRRAVEAAFDVKVSDVTTVRVKGKRKRLRTRKLGHRPDWKKAIVTLEKGQSINLI
jgi:large subunit ribosomal protein L23